MQRVWVPLPPGTPACPSSFCPRPPPASTRTLSLHSVVLNSSPSNFHVLRHRQPPLPSSLRPSSGTHQGRVSAGWFARESRSRGARAFPCGAGRGAPFGQARTNGLSASPALRPASAPVPAPFQVAGPGTAAPSVARIQWPPRSRWWACRWLRPGCGRRGMAHDSGRLLVEFKVAGAVAEAPRRAGAQGHRRRLCASLDEKGLKTLLPVRVGGAG